MNKNTPNTQHMNIRHPLVKEIVVTNTHAAHDPMLHADQILTLPFQRTDAEHPAGSAPGSSIASSTPASSFSESRREVNLRRAQRRSSCLRRAAIASRPVCSSSTADGRVFSRCGCGRAVVAVTEAGPEIPVAQYGILCLSLSSSGMFLSGNTDIVC